MPDCPQWVSPESDEQLSSVVHGLTEFHRFLTRGAAKHILVHTDIREWHGRIFGKVAPLQYYAGNYRSADPAYPCLAKNVQVGGVEGAPFTDVPRLMHELSGEMTDAIKQTDSYISSGSSEINRAKAVVQLAAMYAGKFIRIHPFLNGNGRMSRLISNYVFSRYGYAKPYYAAYPRPSYPQDDYGIVNAACMRGDLDPLYHYLLLSLARKSH
jgi:fido (protein-threonine AMPylation protein)